MRHGCHVKPLNWSSSSWSGGTLHCQQRGDSSRPLLLGTSCAQCFGTEKVFCLMTSCLKAPQSTQVSVETHFKYCNARSRISDMAYLPGVLRWFITTPAHTLLLQCKISYDIWLGTIRSFPYSPDLPPSDFMFLHLKSFLAGQWFHDDSEESRYHVLCIAGGIILQWRDTKTGATLWQLPQEWWKLCQKVVYSMYIKWQ